MDQIGKYEIVGELGKGGFGTVYRGRDPVLKRLVAIKLCTSDSADVRARFQREAEIVASLQHPNITTIYDLGLHDGLPYLVQELLNGEDLSGPIERREPMTLDRKLAILADVARGLEHAHDHGIIHRDIKPGNIRLLEDGSVKVMDFGIAKLASFETKLTKTGMMVGTAAYLAPEQIDDAPIDARCDIFSYGVLAYELLTYQRPFDASTISALLFQILHRPHLPLQGRSPECPPTLAALVDRCLEKSRDLRPQTFGEIRALLGELGARTGPIPRVDASHSTPSAQAGESGAVTSRHRTPSGTHEAETRSYQSGSTPTVAASARRVGASSDQLALDVPTIPSGSMASAQKARFRAPLVAILLVVLAGAGAGGWYAVSQRRPAAKETLAAAPVPGAEIAGTESLPSNEAVPPIEPPAVGATASENEESLATEPPAEQVAALPTRGEPSGANRQPEAPRARRNAAADRTPVEAEPKPAATAREPDRRAQPSAPPTTTRGEVERAPETRSSPPVAEPAIASPVDARPAQASEPVDSRSEPPRSEDVAAPPPVVEPERAASETRAQPPTRTPPVPVDHEPAIRRALDLYRRAYEQLDARLLAEIWPTLGQAELSRIERSFQSFESVEIAIERCAIDVDGDRATADCSVRRAVKPKAGRVQSVEQPTTFRLARRGENWVIEGL